MIQQRLYGYSMKYTMSFLQFKAIDINISSDPSTPKYLINEGEIWGILFLNTLLESVKTTSI